MALILAVGAVMSLPAEGSMESRLRVRNVNESVQVSVTDEIRSFLSNHGVEAAKINGDGSAPEGVNQSLLELNRDDDLREELNMRVTSALVRARSETGKPVYLELGPLAWGYWTDGDEDTYPTLDNDD
jgi:L,D-peptidoglycan transpeptidase YkuD (ErfK/YbiS/YcfS/YnhG family)